MANLFGIGIIRHDSSKMLGSKRFLRIAKQCNLICNGVYLIWSPAKNLQILTALTCRGVKNIEIEIFSFMLFCVSEVQESKRQCNESRDQFGRGK